jgi:hypothetical protein
MGLGIGKAVPTPSTVFNILVGPQLTILSRGAMQPELQIFVGFNMQFVKSCERVRSMEGETSTRGRIRVGTCICCQVELSR